MISVIVPVYKVEKYLHRCVDSILGQTFTDFELILVDDGSPDNCGTICDEYAAKDSRVIVIHQENGGLSAARNAGIDWAFANSDSQWLTFIDSDDWVHLEYLERLLDAAVERKVVISICHFTSTHGGEPVVNVEQIVSADWTPENFFGEHNVTATVAWGKLYCKECFMHVRFPVGKLFEDLFTTYKVLFAQQNVSVVEAPLYYYYQNPDGIVRSSWTLKKHEAYTAREEEIAYFHAHGYQLAHRIQIRQYVSNLHNRLTQMEKDKKSNIEMIRDLKIRKKKYFPKYIKCLNLSDSTDAWVLTQIYPRCMWIYWHWKALLRKLRVIKQKKRR